MGNLKKLNRGSSNVNKAVNSTSYTEAPVAQWSVRQPCKLNIDDAVAKFRAYCKVNLQLADRTVKNHCQLIKQFLVRLKKPEDVTAIDLQEFLMKYQETYSPSSYGNMLKALRRFYRDFLKSPVTDDFKFPSIPFAPKRILEKTEVRRLYSKLEAPLEKAIFLMYATSGMRRTELLNLKTTEVSLDDRMIIPNSHSGRTKHSYVTFFNHEAEEALRQYLNTKNGEEDRLFNISEKRFRLIWNRLGITPQTLRLFFCSEMSKLGVADRYIDAFCGRVPKTVLARHYSDYSPETLKQVYDKAYLKILE